MLVKTFATIVSLWFVIITLTAMGIISDEGFKTKTKWFIYPSIRFAWVRKFECHDGIIFYYSFLFFFHLNIEAK